MPRIQAKFEKAATEKLSDGEYWERRCAERNEKQGDLTGYDCPVCKNKGGIYIATENSFKVRDCECIKTRVNLEMIERSGLSNMLQCCTFEKYQTKESWQETVKTKAMKYLENGGNKWFFIGGASGAGKTHICTAIVGELMKRNRSAKYMMYRDESAILKGIVNSDPSRYEYEMRQIKTVDVLYIDDLFKTKKGAEVSDADVKLMFEIINNRGCGNGKVVIVSTEKTMDEIIAIDEATGGRIRHMATDEYITELTSDGTKNWRLR